MSRNHLLCSWKVFCKITCKIPQSASSSTPKHCQIHAETCTTCLADKVMLQGSRTQCFTTSPPGETRSPPHTYPSLGDQVRPSNVRADAPENRHTRPHRQNTNIELQDCVSAQRIFQVMRGMDDHKHCFKLHTPFASLRPKLMSAHFGG